MTLPSADPEVRIEDGGSEPRDAYWLAGAGAALLVILALRIGLQQGWGAMNRNGMQWLRLARALARFLQLAAEISKAPKREINLDR